MMDIPKSPRTPGEAREAYEQVGNALQAARETLLLHANRLSDPVWSAALTLEGPGSSISRAGNIRDNFSRQARWLAEQLGTAAEGADKLAETIEKLPPATRWLARTENTA